MSNTLVHVTAGRTRGGVVVTNATVKLIEGEKKDKDGLYITVEGGNVPGLRNGRNRIYMENVSCYHAVSEDGAAVVNKTNLVVERTDEEISKDLTETFNILSEMTDAVASGIVRGLVVSGPAGIGKSHTVTSSLVRSLDLLGKLNGMGSMYQIVSGTVSAASLYEMLWNYKEEGMVLVFDDCDAVLYDEDSLNILKAALDSKKTRRIHWNTRSQYLEKNDIPNSFEYQGGIIFITNVKFDQVRSHRISNHLEAIVSRCHYMDIGIDSKREKLIHIRNTVERNDMMREYGFTATEKKEVVDYIVTNHNKLRELSLRMVLKICDCRKAMPTNWTRYVEKTCHLKAA